MKRKEFIKLASTGAFGISSLGYLSCDYKKEIFFKLSLAQWSLHNAFQSGQRSPYEFAKISKELGFQGIEFVSQFYPNVSTDQSAYEDFVRMNKRLSNENNVENVLVMIDDENGHLADENEIKRNESIEMHKNWINASAEIGCSHARLNLYGSKDVDTWKALSMKSLTELGNHAKSLNINVIVENHGRITSNIPELMDVINGVNLKNVGTLPDFGNFCIADEGYGSVFDGTCETTYDFYKGIEEMMPKAFAVSAKSNDFDENGDEKLIDYTRMLKIVKSFGYNSYIGVEYEGERLSEIDGIKATRDLLIKVGQSI